MILSRPQNPPYRAPNRSMPPPPSNSPKRKREPHPTNAPAPAEAPERPSSSSHANPQHHHHLNHHEPPTEASEAGNNSPRSAVAEKFKSLNLQQQQRTNYPLFHHSSNKRPKPNDDDHDTKSWECRRVEVPETPLADSLHYPTQQLRQRYRSPSPFTRHRSSPDMDEQGNGEGAVRSPELLDRQALTWQPAEITGATIDAACGDDDGEGINGIGFRPTAAMAEKRAARRRMQVSEWKAREAREARVKRMVERKKRRGEDWLGGEGDDGDATATRRVRFLELNVP